MWYTYVHVHTHTHTHTHTGILLSHKKKDEIMPFVATWIDLDIIILNEVSEKDKCHVFIYGI